MGRCIKAEMSPASRTLFVVLCRKTEISYVARNMEEFELSIKYRGGTKVFTCSFAQLGYTYRFIVQIDGNEVIFEPDEERNFRARLTSPAHPDHTLREQIALVAAQLEQQLK